MNSKTVIQHLLKESGWTKARLSNALDFETPQAFDRRMLADSPKASFLGAILNKLGYQLVAVPDGSKLPTGSIVIDDPLQIRKPKETEQ